MAGLVHACWKPGCKAFACFGRGVDLMAGKPGKWACSSHVWPDFFSSKTAAPRVVDDLGPGRRPVNLPPSGYQKQGQLL
jgi:hypothetical protein